MLGFLSRGEVVGVVMGQMGRIPFWSGYQRVPQEAAGDAWALQALRESILEEPW